MDLHPALPASVLPALRLRVLAGAAPSCPGTAAGPANDAELLRLCGVVVSGVAELAEIRERASDLVGDHLPEDLARQHALVAEGHDAGGRVAAMRPATLDGLRAKGAAMQALAQQARDGGAPSQAPHELPASSISRDLAWLADRRDYRALDSCTLLLSTNNPKCHVNRSGTGRRLVRDDASNRAGQSPGVHPRQRSQPLSRFTGRLPNAYRRLIQSEYREFQAANPRLPRTDPDAGLIADCRELLRQTDRINEMMRLYEGHEQPEGMVDDAELAMQPVLKRIEQQQARTLPGLRMKGLVLLARDCTAEPGDYSDDDERLQASLLRDVLALPEPLPEAAP